VTLAWLDLGAWVLTAAELIPRVGDSAFEWWLVAAVPVGLVGCVAWLKSSRHARPLVMGAAAFYLVYYATRMYVLDIEPLLAIVPLPQAMADNVYVMWSSPAGRLSRGEVLDASGELWREWLMPLLQIGVLAVAARAR
jgi:hypothetical protein